MINDEKPIVVAASGNTHKIAELQTLFGSVCRIISMEEVGFTDDIEENGSTFVENAIIKAKTVSDATGMAALADDSGLTVDALHGEPGVYSARYCGVHGNDEANNALLLQKMRGVTDRQAEFRCAIALVIPEKEPITTEGICKGIILEKYKGSGGFGYDPLFLYPPLNKTFAEMNDQEKNSCSHRARASQQMLCIMKEQISNAGTGSI